MTHIDEITLINDHDMTGLGSLLRDSVESGASVGFVLPLSTTEVNDYWRGVAADLASGERKLLVLRDRENIIGTAQLALATKPNALHRAEVQKVLVHSQYRRRGFGRVLMEAAENLARKLGRDLLVLDTETFSGGQCLYEAMGYETAGHIPNYALGDKGKRLSTTIMYKEL